MSSGRDVPENRQLQPGSRLPTRTGAQALIPGRKERSGEAAHDDLTSRVFVALYQDFDLYTIGGIYFVVPKGTPCFVGCSLGEIAQRIGDDERAGLAP
jgi:hypothetical protein